MSRRRHHPAVSRRRHGPIAGGRRSDQDRRNGIAATVALVLIVLAVYLAFAQQLPFQSSFVVRGVFASSNELQPGNPVRIAGLPVGTVSEISRGPHNTSVVRMILTEHAGLHSDASLAILPRLLFEGNFYVQLSPGSPAAPPLRSGATIPLAQTSTPVQLDQVLDVLDVPTRNSLSQIFHAFAGGLGSGPGGSGPSGPTTPAAADVPGYTALRTAAEQLAAALPPLAIIARSAQGVAPGDLGAALAGSRDTAAELAAQPAALADLISTGDAVLRALAGGRAALSQDVTALDRLTRVAPRSLTALDGALPVLTRFAAALAPALSRAPVTLRSTSDLFVQLRMLARPAALPALVRGLRPLLAVAPTLESELRPTLNRLDEVGRCTSGKLVPALSEVVQDGANTSGYPAWKDLLHLGAALSGASASFDGNGVALRIGVAEGDQTASGLLPGFGQLTGVYQGEGISPHWLGYGVIPAFRPDQPCVGQPLAQVNG